MATAPNPRKRDQVHEISLKNIEDDSDLQPRLKIDLDVVAEYSTAMLDGEEFPPVRLWFDGIRYWLSDGYHRFRAARKAGLPSIRAYVFPGSKEEALLDSLAANATNGMQRSNADKRRVVLKMLNHPEWSRWTDSEIARRCRVSPTLVSRLRANGDTLGSGVTLRVGGDGQLYDAAKLDQSNRSDGDELDSEPIQVEPPARFRVPPTPLTRADMRDTYVRKIAAHVRKSDRHVELGVKTIHGPADIVGTAAVYLFHPCFHTAHVHEAAGKAIILSATLKRFRVVIVGTLSRSVCQIIRDAEIAVPGLEFTTPEALLAQKPEA